MGQERNIRFGMLFLGLLIVAAPLLLDGCAPRIQSRTEPYPTVDKGMISSEIVRLEQNLAQTVKPEEKVRLLFLLVILHSHPENQSPDYKKAISYMEVYAGIEESVDARYAVSLLKQLDARAVSGEALGQQNIKLKQRADDLKQQNLYHKNIIEKLKLLDIQLEEKRKTMQ